MESYGREEIGVSMYELYNSEQRLLLEMLESVPRNDGERRMKTTCSCGKKNRIYVQPSLKDGWLTEIVCFRCGMRRMGQKEVE